MKQTSTIFIAFLTLFTLLLSYNGNANIGANGIHDPSAIVKLNGVYHVFGTGNNIAHLTSTDLVKWSAAPTVFTTANRPTWMNAYVSGFSGNFWAPDITFMNGKYYLYYSCSTGPKPSAIGVATSTDLTNWTDQGLVIFSTSSSPYITIDPSVFADASGNYWMTFGSHYNGINITQINPLTGKPANSTVTNIAGGSAGEHAASYVTYESGFYYLFFNVGTCCKGVNSTSRIEMGRSANPTGPFIDKNGVSLLNGGGTTALSTAGKYIAPGHFGLFKEGGQNIVTMHYYDNTNAGTAKLDQARLTFGVDGWPVINRDVLPNGRYRIRNINSGLVWEAQGCTGIAGQKLVQNTLNSSAECQLWDIIPVGNGYYKLRNAKSAVAEQVVDVPFCRTDNGTMLGTWDWFNNDCQKFKIEQLANGSYVFSPIGNSNRFIEVPFASKASGVQLGLFDFTDCTCQQWAIEDVNITAPVAIKADNITTNAFTAKWEPVAEATGYQLDVSFSPEFSTTSGSPFINGYNSVVVSGTSKVITGLSANAGYYYRVRAIKNGTASSNSNAIYAYTAGVVDNGMHDPSSIVKEGNTYYTYGTGYGNNNTNTNDKSIVPFTISSSTDLFKWTRGSKTVFPSGKWPEWINTLVPGFGGIFWAPEIAFMNGKYYLYYSASAFGSPKSVIGLVTSPTLDQNSPDYLWTDQGPVVSSSTTAQVNAIDPAILQDSDGKVWLSYGSFAAGLGVIELDPVTGLKKEGAIVTVVAGGNGSAWEAPYILKEGSYYYFFANRQYCCALLNSTYYLVVGRSTSITGPYIDKNGNTLITTSSSTVVGTTVLESSGKFVGPGHLGMMKDNGRNLATMHYYDATSNGYPRLDVAELKFSADGWPVITRDVLPEGRYKISNKNSNLVWESSGCTGNGGQPLVQNTPDANALCQQWDLTPVGDGFYRLKNANGGPKTQVVDIPFCDVNNKLGTWDWLNNDCQKFKIDQLANGSYIFSSYVNGGMVIEVPFASSAPNTQLGLFNYNENDAQRWSIEAVNNSPLAGQSENVTPTGFTAKWDAVPNAVNYKIDAYTATNTEPVAASTIASWNFTSGNKASAADANNTGKTIIPVLTNAATYPGNAQTSGWNDGSGTKYWEASDLNTTGYYGIKVSSKQRSNSSGPRHFKLQYRIGFNGAYADVPGGYVTTADNYTSGSLQDIQLPPICNNQPSVSVRWLMITNTNVDNNVNNSAGTVAASGLSNIDDIVITGSKSPSYTYVPGYENVSVNGTSINISGLEANTKYYFRVRSEVSGVISASSNEVTTTTTCGIIANTATATNVSCFGADNGAITLTTSGGVAPYTYSWNGPEAYTATKSNISNLKPGDYNVSVTQGNGCVSNSTFTITEPTELIPAIADAYAVTKGGQPNTIYLGYGPASLTLHASATGGTPAYTYEWKDGNDMVMGNRASLTVTPALEGTYYYKVAVKDNLGCIKEITKTVFVKDIRCAAGKVNICHVPTDNPSNAKTICINTDAVSTHLQRGSYLGSCTNSSKYRMMYKETKEREQTSINVNVFPNPTAGNFTVGLNNLKKGKVQIALIDITGRIIISKSIELTNSSQLVEFNNTKMQEGMYMIKVNAADGEFTVPMIVTR